ncbi:MAG TPA: glycoside hydrolase family 15 protein [Acidimicrobiales bacterium]|nr:glycoside hydrolase family 15 protein [Acidimicrobiales bacterium]
MTQLIEDYAMIGDTETAALVGRDGSIDWLCLPRFDSGSCFASLLGESNHGRWQVTADDEVTSHVRRYQGKSMVLETEISTATGVVQVVDFMPPRHHHPRVVRIVRGVEGAVRMRIDLVMRFEYGYDVPWVRSTDRGVVAIAGPNALVLDSPIELTGLEMRHEGKFTVEAGEEVVFVLAWYRSHEDPPFVLDASRALRETLTFWGDWCAGVLPVHGEWEDLALRSLITLKGLTYAPTGGIVAAATTSLPESLGGVRNWDYRYCWIRDAALTLESLIASGLRGEAESWLTWLGRVAAGDPEQLQIMYGPAGERRLTELEIDWLPGYEGSSPVRIGNAAFGQFQLDVYGHLMDAIDRARSHDIAVDAVIWRIQVAIMRFLADHWSEPDDGIWEVRGPRRLFTHSKVMTWVAFDRAVRGVEVHGLEGPVDEWRVVRDAIHDEVCEKGWNADVGAFTQSYGAVELDASLLMIPIVGFLSAEDERVVRTVDAIQERLMNEGFVLRYANDRGVDGLPGREGMFLPCTLWLVGCLRLMGRLDEATAVFRRVIALVNDVGLISEEYDPVRRRLLGNFPQAFTHVGIVNASRGLTASRTANQD